MPVPTNGSTLDDVVRSVEALNVSVSTGGKSTAASPTYVEGATAQPLSQDLHGALRVLMQNPDGTSVDPALPATVEGSVSSGSAVSTAKPVLVGGRAATAAPTAVADGQAVRAMYDKLGRNVNAPHAPRDLIGDAVVTCSNTTAAQDLAAQGVGVYSDIISITLANSSATGTVIELYDSDGTTLRWVGYAPPTDMRGITFPVLLKAAATNVVWKLKTVTAVTAVKATFQFAKNS